MTWESPAFVEITMSAEIGGYGRDFTDSDPSGPPGPVARPGPTIDRADALDVSQP